MSEPNLTVRPATAADVPAIVEVFRAGFGRDYVSHSEMFEGRATPAGEPRPEAGELLLGELPGRMADFAEGVVVAVADGRVVGFAMGRLADAAGDVYAVLEDIVVLAEYRRREVGSHLLDAVAAAAAARGAGHLFAESGVNNESAHTFLAGRGFTTVSKVFRAVLGGPAAGG